MTNNTVTESDMTSKAAETREPEIPQSAIDRLALFMLTKLQNESMPSST